MVTYAQMHEDTMPAILMRILNVWNVDMNVVRSCSRELHQTHTRIYNKHVHTPDSLLRFTRYSCFTLLLVSYELHQNHMRFYNTHVHTAVEA
jgi:hypothetical protein